MDIASSLAQDEIPIKLRCAICNRLVVNAFKLPCCDQSICESCQSALPDTCPVCAHSPLSADDCKPNKSLRMTVKAFTKSEEKKREKERAGSIAAGPVTPIEPATAAAPVVESVEQPADLSEQQPPDAGPTTVAEEIERPGDDGRGEDDGAQASVEDSKSLQKEDDAANNAEQRVTSQAVAEDEADGSAEKTGQDAQVGTGEAQYGDGQNIHAAWNGVQGQTGMFGGGFAFDGTQAGFSGMDWTGANGFNPMMQMQMQNNIQSGNWNGYPNMMDMSGMGMGMNPMGMQQGMFGGYGGQDMGMNGMNGMNMGMGYGAGYDGWNGQQMSNDFGAQAGFYPGGGYNQQSHQGHFPHQMHQQRYQKHNYQNQNRFQGQGAYSQRGHGHQGNFGGVAGQGHGNAQSQGQNQARGAPNQASLADDDPFSYQLPAGLQGQRSSQQPSVESTQQQAGQATATRDESATKPADAPDQADDQDVGKGQDAVNAAVEGEVKPDVEVATDAQEEPAEDRPNEGAATAETTQRVEGRLQDGTFNKSNMQYDSVGPAFDTTNNSGMNIAANPMMMSVPPGSMTPLGAQVLFDPVMQASPHVNPVPDYAARGRGGMRGGFGRGDFAFRGGFGGRGVKGFVPNGNYGHAGAGAQGGDFTVVTPVEPKGQGVEGAPTGPKAMREGLPNVGFRGRGGYPGVPGRGGHAAAAPSVDGARSREKSRSPDRDRSYSRSRSRSRSRSPSRRHRRRHRHRSPSTATESESHERRRERRRHRSSRKYDDEGDDARPDGAEIPQEASDKARENRSRDASAESSPRHRSSRHDRDKHRSSRSHRDRSREHRRRRHRSRSPIDEEEQDAGLANGSEMPDSETGSRRKSRGEKHRDRDRDEKRERDRDRGRDRDRDEPEREKDRDRDRDRDRKRSRRSPSAAHSDSDRHHRSSRRSRRDRGKDRERERQREKDQPRPSDRDHAPTDQQEFKIQGRSRMITKPAATPSVPSPMRPPTGPKAAHARPPTAPAAERSANAPPVRERRASHSSAGGASAATAAQDPHTLEREARNRERMLKEQQRRQSLHSSAHAAPSLERQPSERKRTREAGDAEDGAEGEKPFAPPTGPSAERKRRRREGGAAAEEAGRRARRVSHKYEDEENNEARARRVEVEREAARWG